jgi:hypothetical protein
LVLGGEAKSKKHEFGFALCKILKVASLNDIPAFI